MDYYFLFTDSRGVETVLSVDASINETMVARLAGANPDVIFFSADRRTPPWL